MKAINVTRNAMLGDNVGEARSCLARMKGLLGTFGLLRGEGLWISPCGSLHSFGMQYEFDALFIDARDRIVGLYRHFPRNRVSRIHWKACGVLELPAGTIDRTGTCLGDFVALHRVPGIDR